MPVILLQWPDSKLLPNRKNGKFWGTHQSAKENARIDGYKAAKDGIGTWVPPEGNIALSIVFNPPDKRRRDIDGALSSLKHHLDGMASALGVDDSRFRPVMLDWGHSGKPGSVIVAIGVKIISAQDL